MQLLDILGDFIIFHNLKNTDLQTKSKDPVTSNLQIKVCFDQQVKPLKHYSNNYIYNNSDLG